MSQQLSRVRMSLLLAAIILLGMALRLYRLEDPPLRGDEAVSAALAALPWPEHLAGALNSDPPTPLYHLVMHIWVRWAGESEFALRFLSVWFSLLTIPLLYRLGDLVARHPIGVLGAFLWAVNPFQIWHAQDARNYSFWPALSLAALVLMLRAWRTGEGRDWLGYLVLAVLALFSHAAEGLALLASNVLFLVLVATRTWVAPGQARRWVMAQVLLGSAYGIYLLTQGGPLSRAALGDAPSLAEMAWRMVNALALGEGGGPEMPLLVGGVYLGTLVLGLLAVWRKEPRFFIVLGVYLVIPLLSVFVLDTWRPLFRERYLNALAPAYLLAWAGGVWALGQFLLRRTWSVLLILPFFLLPQWISLDYYYHNPQAHKSPDWRALTHYLRERVGAEDVIIETYADPALAYYYRGPVASVVVPPTNEASNPAIDGQLRELISSHPYIWYLPIGERAETVQSWLERRSLKREEAQVAEFRVILYETPARFLTRMSHFSGWRLGGGIELIGSDLAIDGRPVRESPSAALPVGGSLQFVLYWRSLQEVETSYHVFTHLVDSQDRIWGQWDQPPQGGDFPTSEWKPGDVIWDIYIFKLDPQAPPGQYRLLVGMYELDSGQRLPVYDPAGTLRGDHLTLASLWVSP